MARRNPQRRRSTQVDWLLLVLLLPGILAAVMLGAQRYGAEADNRSVELVLDYSELQSLSVSSGAPMPEILERFKSSGVTGIAVSEDLLGDLAASGQVSYMVSSSPSGPLTEVRVRDAGLWSRVFRSLNARVPSQSSGVDGVVVSATPLTLSTMGIGLSPDAVRMVQAAELDVVARLQNHPALTERAIDASLADVKRDGITRLICAGEEVLGFRGLVPYAAKSIQSSGLIFGSVEFARQRGDARMCRELDAGYVRVHSISNAEMAGLAPSAASERFVRAVKERNIRLCYIRLPETSGVSPLHNGAAFVGGIRDGLENAGYRTGIAGTFDSGPDHRRLPMLIALSIAAGAVLLLVSAVSVSTMLKYGLLLAGGVGAAGLAVIGGTGREILALAAAIIFPTLGIMLFISPHFKRASNDRRPGLKAVGLFIGVSAFTLIGALMVTGLLVDRSYMVKLDQFSGVKIAHLVPLLGIVFAMAAGLPVFGKPFAQVRREVSANLRRLSTHPLFVWHVLAVFAAIGILGFALLRTGNDPGVGVTGIELKFRSLLDQIMSVRPRTKEFLIGHPALILGTALLLTRRRGWGLPLVALGVIGQVSLLNTFCHIHTPLMVTILRSTNGLILGLVLGVAAWLLVGKARRAGGPQEKA